MARVAGSAAGAGTGPYEIVRYEDGFREQVLQLQRHLWGPNLALNRAYFDWKYRQNPFMKRPVACLALHHGRVVGMRGIYGARWQAGHPGRQFDLPYTDDLVIAPEHRDRGLARRLIRALLDYGGELGYPFLLSFRAAPVTLIASLAEGYRAIGTLEPMFRAGRAHRQFQAVRGFLARRRFVWRFAQAAALYAPIERRPFVHFDRAARSGKRRPEPPVELASVPRPGAMARLCARLPADDRIRHVRSEGYLDWIFRNPRLEYRYLFWGSEPLEGYLVLDRVRSGWRVRARVNVSDWEATSDAVGTRLMADAIRSGSFPELFAWTATCPERSREALTRLGFLPTEPGAQARERALALLYAVRGEVDDTAWTIDGRAALDISNWKIRMLDQD
jgi:GNAT superfamily N-acetyltransferase